MNGDRPQDISGRLVLVVEDEYFLAADIARGLTARGARILGPAAGVAEAIDLIEGAEQLDGAVLDLNLQGEMAYPSADALQALNVPFIFATGYDQSSIPAAYAQVRRCEKPVMPDKIAAELFG